MHLVVALKRVVDIANNFPNDFLMVSKKNKHFSTQIYLEHNIENH